MKIYNMTRQELLFAVSGGIILGLATSLVFVLFGKILSASSFLRTTLLGNLGPKNAKKITLLIGLVFSSAFLNTLYRDHTISFWPFDKKKFIEQTDPGMLVVAGLLVGLGVAFMHGGIVHDGVCGLSRFSKRSFVAVLLFGLCAFFTNEYKLSASIRTVTDDVFDWNLPRNLTCETYMIICLLVPFFCFLMSEKKSLKMMVEFLLLYGLGVAAGAAFMIGGLTEREDYLHLFKYDRLWDPTILVFFVVATLINLCTFNFMIYTKRRPLFATHLELPEEKIDFGLILGSILYGIGWGLCGIDPVSYCLLMVLPDLKITIFWGVSFVLGVQFGEVVKYLPLQKLQKKK